MLQAARHYTQQTSLDLVLAQLALFDYHPYFRFHMPKYRSKIRTFLTLIYCYIHL